MPDKPNRDKRKSESEGVGTLNRDNFARTLGSILESASSMFPATGKAGIKFSVALVGEMEKDEFAGLVGELPVVASIALRKEIGEKAALLTDVPTASVLIDLLSAGKHVKKETLSDGDLVSLYDAFGPILDSLSQACEEAMNCPFGAIENVGFSDPANPNPMVEQLSKELSAQLCRATASIAVGGEKSGQIVLVLPLDLAEMLAAHRPEVAAGESEQAELQREDTRIAVSEMEQAELQQEDIDVLLTQAAGTSEPETQETPFPAEGASAPVERPPEGRATREPTIKNIDLIMDIQLTLTARLGQMEMPMGEIMKLSPGSVIDIDRFVDEPIELVVNDRLIARGDIVIVQENFGIKISEVVSPRERIQSLR